MRTMKRLLLLFLMVFLPLQMSWGAVESYCEHEKGRAAQHFGHHDHKHDASYDKLQAKDKQKPQGKVVVDPDCDRCHHAHASMAPMPTAQLVCPLGTVAVSSTVLPYRSHIPDTPFRPDRRYTS